MSLKVKRNGGLTNIRCSISHFFFNNVRRETYQQASLLFGSQDEDDGVQPPDERTEQEKLKDLTDFYYKTYMILAKEDVTKIDDILNLSLQEALSYLLYMINKWNREKEEMEKSRNKNRIK